MDDKPKYIAKSVQEKRGILQWPRHSPDLNQIEQLFSQTEKEDRETHK